MAGFSLVWLCRLLDRGCPELTLPELDRPNAKYVQGKVGAGREGVPAGPKRDKPAEN